MEAYRYQLENERPVQTEQLLTASPEDTRLTGSSFTTMLCSSPVIEEYQQEIDQLREHLNKVELQLKKTSSDYQSLVEKHDALIEERTLFAIERYFLIRTSLLLWK